MPCGLENNLAAGTMLAAACRGHGVQARNNRFSYNLVKNPGASPEASIQFRLFSDEASFEECNPPEIQYRFIMYNFIIPTLFISVTSSAFAVVLTTLPSPMTQGSGMIHIDIAYDEDTGILSSGVNAGTPNIKPLTEWKPGDTFDPASPWYTTLDPTQAAGMFNSQFGLVMYNSDPLPLGSKIMVNLVSATAGLETYLWKNTVTQAFQGIMGTNGSAVSWDWSSVAHGMFHPMFVLPSGSSGSASAILGLTLVDSLNAPLPGGSTQATLNFQAIPEPSSLLLVGAGTAMLAFRRSKPLSLS
jgi:hypothetical protein